MKSVTICGKGIGCELAPAKGEIWGINDFFYEYYKRNDRHIDLMFEMHDYTWDLDRCLRHQVDYVHQYFDDDYLIEKACRKLKIWPQMTEKINEWKIPFMSVRKYDFIPTSMEYPLEDVIKKLDSDFFSCGISYMIAYAIYKEYERIDLFGCNMEANTEWSYQRPSVEFWIGMARGRGINVKISGTDCRPLRTTNGRLYGYDRYQGFKGLLVDVEIERG